MKILKMFLVVVTSVVVCGAYSGCGGGGGSSADLPSGVGITGDPAGLSSYAAEMTATKVTNGVFAALGISASLASMSILDDPLAEESIAAKAFALSTATCSAAGTPITYAGDGFSVAGTCKDECAAGNAHAGEQAQCFVAQLMFTFSVSGDAGAIAGRARVTAVFNEGLTGMHLMIFMMDDYAMTYGDVANLKRIELEALEVGGAASIRMIGGAGMVGASYIACIPDPANAAKLKCTISGALPDGTAYCSGSIMGPCAEGDVFNLPDVPPTVRNAMICDRGCWTLGLDNGAHNTCTEGWRECVQGEGGVAGCGEVLDGYIANVVLCMGYDGICWSGITCATDADCRSGQTCKIGTSECTCDVVSEMDVEKTCNDGIDNDANDLIDMDDPDCMDLPPETQCTLILCSTDDECTEMGCASCNKGSCMDLLPSCAEIDCSVDLDCQSCGGVCDTIQGICMDPPQCATLECPEGSDNCAISGCGPCNTELLPVPMCTNL